MWGVILIAQGKLQLAGEGAGVAYQPGGVVSIFRIDTTRAAFCAAIWTLLPTSRVAAIGVALIAS
jgi:hypothetical protein